VAVKHIFPTIRAVKASLEQGLPARIAAFNAEPENGVQLIVPAAYYEGAEDLLEAGGFPAVEIWIPAGRMGPFAIGNADANVDDRVVVSITAWGDTGEARDLYETLAGYGRCAIEVLVEPDAFGPDIDISNVPGAVTYDYGIVPADALQTKAVSKWRGNAALTFLVEDVTPLP
jgi:hypothetical protein